MTHQAVWEVLQRRLISTTTYYSYSYNLSQGLKSHRCATED